MTVYTSRFPDAPPRIARLRVSAQGFPVPWFVYDAGPDHEPDLRVADQEKFARAKRSKLCWVCGQPLGRHQVFVIGPMCAVNRVTSEPPNHRECAEFAAKHCPFLSRPEFTRSPRVKRAAGLEDKLVNAAGMAIPRNPGVACLWETETWKLFKPHAGNPGYLIQLGNPTRVDWWREGRAATRSEVEASIGTGLPLLMEIALMDPGGVEELERQTAIVTRYLPKEEDHGKPDQQHHHPAPASSD